MSEKPEITRNDVAAIAFMRKIMDRLEADKEAYDTRMQQFNLMYSLTYNPYGSLGVAPMKQVQQAQLYSQQYNAIAAQYGNQTPGHSHSIGISIPHWEPYLTQAEYDTLKAWSDGEDILIHILSTER